MDYQNGKIYKITNCIDNEVYIGSTTQSLVKRFSWHKNRITNERFKNTKVYKHINDLGFDKFCISLIEDYPCTNKTELRRREGELIREHGTLNTDIAGRTREEWNEENKEKRSETKKEYRENNKEKIAIQKKEYYENNKETFLEKRKVYIENNKEKIAEQKKEYYVKNKEKIEKYKNEYYQNNKEKILEKNRETIECDICKSIVVQGNLNRHKKTIKCKNHVN